MRQSLIVAAAVAVCASFSLAGSVGVRTYNTAVSGSDLSAYLSSADGGLSTTGGYTNSNGGFKIAWNITPVTGGYEYCYTLSSKTGGNVSKAISHFIIELSSNVGLCDLSQFSHSYVDDKEVKTHDPHSSANPFMPESIYGLKIDTRNDPRKMTFSFVVDRVPVWGNFFAKGGKKSGVFSTAFNAGFSTNAGDQGYFIARPDSVPSLVTTIPLPAAAWAGLALFGVAGVMKANRNRRALSI